MTERINGVEDLLDCRCWIVMLGDCPYMVTRAFDNSADLILCDFRASADDISTQECYPITLSPHDDLYMQVLQAIAGDDVLTDTSHPDWREQAAKARLSYESSLWNDVYWMGG